MNVSHHFYSDTLIYKNKIIIFQVDYLVLLVSMACQVLQVQKVIQVTSVNLVLAEAVVDLVLKDKRVYQKRNENRSKTKLLSLSLSFVRCCW